MSFKYIRKNWSLGTEIIFFIEETSGKLRYFHIQCWQHQSSTPIIFRYNWEVIENLSIITSKLPQLLRKTLPHYSGSHTQTYLKAVPHTVQVAGNLTATAGNGQSPGYLYSGEEPLFSTWLFDRKYRAWWD